MPCVSLLLEPAQVWGGGWGRAHVYRGEGGSEAKLLAAVPGEAFDHPLDRLTSLPMFVD